MLKIGSISTALCFIILLFHVFESFCYSVEVPENEVENSDESDIKLGWFPFKNSFPYKLHLDICECENERCACCVQLWKYNVCDTVNLVVKNETQLALDFEFKVNNKSVFADIINIEELPEKCFTSETGLSMCLIHKVETMKYGPHPTKVCFTVAMKIANHTFADAAVYCVKTDKILPRAVEGDKGRENLITE